MHVFRIAVLTVAAASLALTGCASDDEGSSDAGSMAESFEFGQPADPADADRTVEIDANDDFSFDPDAIAVEAGEVVTFNITNTGNLPHDFTLGPEDVQQEHEEEMAEMAEGESDDDPNAVSVAAGETATITWGFTVAGDVLYGCHVQGHYEAGMVGTIDVA